MCVCWAILRSRKRNGTFETTRTTTTTTSRERPTRWDRLYTETLWTRLGSFAKWLVWPVCSRLYNISFTIFQPTTPKDQNCVSTKPIQLHTPPPPPSSSSRFFYTPVNRFSFDFILPRRRYDDDRSSRSVLFGQRKNTHIVLVVRLIVAACGASKEIF